MYVLKKTEFIPELLNTVKFTHLKNITRFTHFWPHA